ncbi:MAG: hypothetical protein ABSG40_22550 [Terriglobales bacterium]|jgi:undecaprenyl pyrophosphate synthase
MNSMSPKKKIERLVDGLLAVPEWYAAILNAQRPAREVPLTMKELLKRINEALSEGVKAHMRVEEVPELHRLEGFIRRAAKYLEPKEETAGAKATLPKAMGRSIARPPRRPQRRSPRSSA